MHRRLSSCPQLWPKGPRTDAPEAVTPPGVRRAHGNGALQTLLRCSSLQTPAPLPLTFVASMPTREAPATAKPRFSPALTTGVSSAAAMAMPTMAVGPPCRYQA